MDSYSSLLKNQQHIQNIKNQKFLTQNQNNKTSLLPFDSHLKRIYIACLIYFLNIFLIFMLQIFIYADIENINLYMNYISFFILIICEFIVCVILKENKNYFLLIISLIFNLTLYFSVFFYNNNLLIWMPIIFMKHYVNIFFARNKKIFIFNETVNCLCILIFCLNYHFIFFILILISNFFYNRNLYVGTNFLIVILFNWHILFIDGIHYKIISVFIEFLILLILNKLSKTFSLLLEKEYSIFNNDTKV